MDITLSLLNPIHIFDQRYINFNIILLNMPKYIFPLNFST